MTSMPRGDYETIEAMDGQTVTGTKFFVVVAGTTNDTHIPIVSRITQMRYVQVDSPMDCDFLLVFCPIVSRVGTDISEALQNLDSDKQKVLVVMHHTFNPDTVIAESKRQVQDPKVLLTVDYLFYERELLNCDRNDIAWDQICRSLSCPSSQTSCLESCTRWCMSHKMTIGLVSIIVVTVIVISSYYGSRH